jgi:hypothetical protein
MLGFLACAGRNSGVNGQGGTNKDDPDNQENRHTATVGVDYDHPNLVDHGDSVSITFSQEMFENVELSDEFVEVNDYIGAVRNSDGTVTIQMSKQRQQLFLDAFRGDIDYNAEYFISEVDFLHKVTYAPDLRSLDIYVTGGTPEADIQEILYLFIWPLEQYQIMLGREVHIALTAYNSKTEEAILSIEFS